jgi:hypothetical protein
MKKNVAGQKIGTQMINATGSTAFTGSVTVSVTGDAGTQATGSVGSGACTHEGNGYHTYAPAQAETNYDLVAFTFIGTGAVPETVQVFTVPDPSPKVWFVQADTGSDSNDGKSWATAKLTVASAISASSAGDKIMLGLGTYAENVVINKHGITLEGVSRAECIIEPASGTACGTSKENVTVRRLQIKSNTAAADVGFTCLSHDGLVIEDCDIFGSFDGLQTGGSHNVRIRNCYVEGKYDGANLGQCTNFYAENCTFKSTANYAGSDTAFRGVVAVGSSADPTVELANGRFVNCNFIVSRTTSGVERVSGLELDGAWTIIGGKIAAKSSHASHTGGVYGLREPAALPHQISCIGVLFSTSGAAGTVEDINNAQAASRVDLTNCNFDADKVTGTVYETLQPLTLGTRLALDSIGQVTNTGAGTGPVAQTPVAEEFTVTVPARSSTNLAAARSYYVQPNEKVMMAFDFVNILHEGDSIAEFETLTEDTSQSITLTIIGVCGSQAKFWVEDVVADLVYRVEGKVTTSFGLTLEGDFVLSTAD